MSDIDRTSNKFIVPTPLKGRDGNFVQDGWTASVFCDGDDNPKRKLKELLVASRSFHGALKDIPEPPFLNQRTHPWAVGDRVAWREQEVEIVPALASIYIELVRMRQDVVVTSQPQLVHGDLSGNTLFSDGSSPVIIDFSPFWRCVEYAEAIAVVDGIMDFDQGKELIDLGGSGHLWLQLVVRALIFRLVARSQLTGIFGVVSENEMGRFRVATDMLREKMYVE
jgi:uncharacterized protein (TIGR02569 family)